MIAKNRLWQACREQALAAALQYIGSYQSNQQRPSLLASCLSAVHNQGTSVLLHTVSSVEQPRFSVWLAMLHIASLAWCRSQTRCVCCLYCCVLLYGAVQAVQQGSVQGLLSAAAATRNSLCGLYPLAVALQALYGNISGAGSSSSSSSGGVVSARMPQLLGYTPAHLIFPRPDSTGFAVFAVYAQ
jgi:hypothetical protein